MHDIGRITRRTRTGTDNVAERGRDLVVLEPVLERQVEVGIVGLGVHQRQRDVVHVRHAMFVSGHTSP